MGFSTSSPSTCIPYCNYMTPLLFRMYGDLHDQPRIFFKCKAPRWSCITQGDKACTYCQGIGPPVPTSPG